jgi:all-trans-retinol 13,14-reductase
VPQSLVRNKKAAAILCALWPDMGATPDRASFAMLACVGRGLALEGGCFPVGGSDEMARALVPTIEGAGGRVLVRAQVRRILTTADENDGVGGGGEGGGGDGGGRTGGGCAATGILMADGTNRGEGEVYDLY